MDNYIIDLAQLACSTGRKWRFDFFNCPDLPCHPTLFIIRCTCLRHIFLSKRSDFSQSDYGYSFSSFLLPINGKKIFIFYK